MQASFGNVVSRLCNQVLALDGVLHTHKRIRVPGEIAAREDVGTLAIDKILALLAGGTP